MNDRGRGSGLALLVILVVALIIALLVARQMESLGVAGAPHQQDATVPAAGAVGQAQDAVDAINSRMKLDVEGLE